MDPLYPVGANEAHQKNSRKKMAGSPAAGLQMINPGAAGRTFPRENGFIIFDIKSRVPDHRYYAKCAWRYNGDSTKANVAQKPKDVKHTLGYHAEEY